MLEKGSYVIYRSEGVCIIRDICKQSFGAIGNTEDYYILSPVKDPKSTVFVPVGNTVLVSFMRELLSAAQINALAAEQRGKRLEWISDSRSRNNALKEILARGDRKELIVLINTVSEKLDEIRQSGRKVGAADLTALSRAKKMLYEEFSATTDISSPDGILPLLKGELTLKPKT